MRQSTFLNYRKFSKIVEVHNSQTQNLYVTGKDIF